MKHFGKQVIVAISALTLTLAACGDDNPKQVGLNAGVGDAGTDAADGCDIDGDCPTGTVCDQEIRECVPSCDTSENCAEPDVCIPRPEAAGNICKSVPCEGDGPDETCEALLGTGSTCESGFCSPAPGGTEVVTTIQVIDVTNDTAACGVGDPGADMQGIELQDIDGNTLAWGTIIGNAVETTGNDEVNLDVIDGTTPNLDENGCVDSFSGNVLSLGCTGWIGVEFLDAQGGPIPLENDQTVVVYEFGAECSTGSSADAYTVAVCDDSEQVAAGVDDSCTNTLGTSSGIDIFEVVGI